MSLHFSPSANITLLCDLNLVFEMFYSSQGFNSLLCLEVTFHLVLVRSPTMINRSPTKDHDEGFFEMIRKGLLISLVLRQKTERLAFVMRYLLA